MLANLIDIEEAQAKKEPREIVDDPKQLKLPMPAPSFMDFCRQIGKSVLLNGHFAIIEQTRLKLFSC